MEKKTGIFLAKEVLYLLLMLLVMAGATAFQLLLKDDAYLYSGGSFLGSGYDYNWFFYFAGFKLFLLGALGLYLTLLKKSVDILKDLKTLGTILYFVFGIVFSVLGLAAEFTVTLFMVGLFNDITPLAWGFSILALPVFQLAFLIFLFVSSRQSR